jgi:hypothetical protein
MLRALLIVHIFAGTIALSSALVAIGTKALDLGHRWHIYAGTTFFLAMILIFVTALPMALIRRSAFLVLISIFSLYLVLRGWRIARNRVGTPNALDWVTSGVMAVAAVGMVITGGLLIGRGDTLGIVLLAFGALGAVLSWIDAKQYRVGSLRGKERIVQHLNRMLAATIATLTAFAVINIRIEAWYLVWLAPTVLITPIIILWSRRIHAGVRPKGMP